MTEKPPPTGKPARGLSARIVELFITSKLSPLFLIASFCAGVLALIVTPREEEPQIVVPLADVIVRMPGASAEEVEKLVASPLEQKLWEIDGVEYVYSMSRPGEAIVTVRFYVGQDRERSLVKVWNKVMSNKDAFPPGVREWTVKPVEIDDVPIVLFTLSSVRNDMTAASLRRIADEVAFKLSGVLDAGKTAVVGGEPRRVTVYLDPLRLAAAGMVPLDIVRALGAANIKVVAGAIARGNCELALEAGPPFGSPEEIGALVLAAPEGRPLYLRDLARIEDGPGEPESYTRIGFGPAVAHMRTIGGPDRAARPFEERPSATIALAKKKGTNAVRVAERAIAAFENLRGSMIPDDVTVTIARNYGETANHKVNELVKHLLLAIATILVLLAFALGPKEAFIVAIAVPMTLAITLLCDLIFGYTINRVTLFALILSLGLLVDDPIVDVENISRHFRLRREPPLEATLTAVDEVRPPTILATFTVIVSFLPMFFISGMMGPYMAPMAFNVPIAMLVSLLTAFTVTPWASYHLLERDHGGNDAEPFDVRRTAGYRLYRRVLFPLLRSRKRAFFFLSLMLVAFVFASALAAARAVPLKMLPFDNKNELAIVVDMPAGTALEKTDRALRDLGRFLATVPEVTDYEVFCGLASPIDFNGLVRHYYLRRGGHVGDIRVNLLPKEERAQGSHEIALRIRPEIARIAKAHGANIKIVESPPGPPVLSTLVAEVYGPLTASYDELVAVSKTVRAAMERTEGAVDVDDMAEAEHSKIVYRLDREKAALTGVLATDVAETLRVALEGARAGTVHIPQERLPLEIEVRLPRAARSTVLDLLPLRVRSASGALVPLGEIGSVAEVPAERTIYHKNLRRLAIVTAEVAGRSPLDVVLDLGRHFAREPLPSGFRADFAGEGEWKITLEVFRDLGIAFAAALVMIYVLLVAQTGSLEVPLVIMLAIPLTVIGIMPGFYLLNALFSRSVGDYPAPIFFTATGMIGMIALAGIVVRNSIILIDFIEHLRGQKKLAAAAAQGVSVSSLNARESFAECVIEAGATRLRPIFLTAGAAMFGSIVITLDPIFSGLAWSFIFGIFASTLLTLVVVPLVYYLLER
jgi:multidrug efflux pump subunit AcrB